MASLQVLLILPALKRRSALMSRTPITAPASWYPATGSATGQIQGSVSAPSFAQSLWPIRMPIRAIGGGGGGSSFAAGVAVALGLGVGAGVGRGPPQS